MKNHFFGRTDTASHLIKMIERDKVYENKVVKDDFLNNKRNERIKHGSNPRKRR